MIKTQIYLDDELYKSLKEESLRTGKSISNLITEKLRKIIEIDKNLISDKNKLNNLKPSPSLDEIIETLKKHKDVLKKNYSVKKIGIFGSYVRGEQRNDSDLDILIEYERPMTLIKFVELEDYLSKLLGVKVDLVSKKALKPNIRKRVLKEVIYI